MRFLEVPLCSTVKIFAEQLQEGDVEGLKRLKTYLHSEIQRLANLFPKPKDFRLLHLMMDLKSSSFQLPVSIRSLLEISEMWYYERKSWQEILEIMTRAFKRKELELIPGKKIPRVDELTLCLWSWLLQCSPQIVLDGEFVVLTYPTDNNVPLKLNYYALTTSPWPPDPKNDIVLKTYLEVLGWRMWIDANKVYLIPNEHFDPASLPLKQKLQLAWTRHQNPPASEVYQMIRRKYNAEWIQKNMPRLCAVLDTLIAEKIKEEKKREDLVVCVAAHGSVDFFAIVWLLHRGVTVVSREKAIYHNSMFLDSAEMRSANREGRLILSDYTKPHPAQPYDIIIWSHPAPRDLPVVLASYSADGRLTMSSNPISEMVVENLKPDGWFLMQTDKSYQFIDLFYGDTGRFEALWQENSLSNTNYLMPSSHLDTDDKPTLVLFRRKQEI